MAAWAVEPGDHVLEPSAGIGSLVFAALDAGALSVTAVEIDPGNCTALCRIGMDRCASGGMDVHGEDFIPWSYQRAHLIEDRFDAVVMNPPFSRNQDIAHVRAAWSLLRPGGKLIAVTSPHWTFAQDRASQEFRDWLPGTWEDLPEGTFKAFGTMVRTVLIKATKP
jgi:predicted RNA methylase